eukprot:864183-Rhodomonas_salina.2
MGLKCLNEFADLYALEVSDSRKSVLNTLLVNLEGLEEVSVGEEKTGSKKRVTWEQEGEKTSDTERGTKRKAHEEFIDVDTHEEE